MSNDDSNVQGMFFGCSSLSMPEHTIAFYLQRGGFGEYEYSSDSDISSNSDENLDDEDDEDDGEDGEDGEDEEDEEDGDDGEDGEDGSDGSDELSHMES